MFSLSRNRVLNIMQMNCVPVCIKGHAMAQAVSRRPVTAEVHVQSCEICSEQSGKEQVSL